jgi:hypothetical protein
VERIPPQGGMKLMKGRIMANPIVIFARPADPRPGKAWQDLTIAAFDDQGRRLDKNFEAGTLIVLNDTIDATDIPTQFDATHPVLWVEHGSKPPSPEQRAVIGQWPNATRTMAFSHVEGTEIYDNLTIILNRDSGQTEIASAIRKVTDGISIDVQWKIVNRVAILRQARKLDPEADLDDVEAEIRETELGSYLLDQEFNPGEVEGAIAEEVQRLSELQAP